MPKEWKLLKTNRMPTAPRISHVTAVILAGGAGTRLRTVIADRPKALAPVAGKPFLAHLLDQLSGQGVRQAVLCTGYLGDQVEACFGRNFHGLTLAYSSEERPLGTAGAIRHALPQVDSDPLLVLNGDSYCETDLAASLAWHCQRRARATLVLAHVDEGSRFGRVETAADGRIVAFQEKSGAENPGWINSGVYWFERSIFASLPSGQPCSLERDLLAVWRGPGLYGYRQPGRFLDIGIPQDYARAEEFLAGVAAPAAALAG
jgi:NDP-sugar pyrophosphorylase family protein